MRSAISSLFLLLIAFSFISCGGGTSGSGVGVVKGEVREVAGAPIGGATVAVIETGDIAVTNPDGSFEIPTSQPTDRVTLQVSDDIVDVKVPVGDVPSNAQAISIAVVIDRDTNTGAATVIDYSKVGSFSLSATVVGACGDYFENTQKGIVQTKELRDGTECVLKATVFGDDSLEAGVLVGIERRGCEPNAQWRLTATARTESGPHQGIAQVPFRFFNSLASCEYRISAPYRDPKGRADRLYLHTLTQQAKESVSN